MYSWAKSPRPGDGRNDPIATVEHLSLSANSFREQAAVYRDQAGRKRK